MKLSIVATLYRSEPFLREFYRRSVEAARQLTDDFEIVLVNDGSPDNSLQAALELHRSDGRVRIVDLSRNFGHHQAMLTGLEFSRGDLVLLIDSDLEESPEWLSRFYDMMQRTSADVVYGVQASRRGGWVEQASGWVFYKVFNSVASHTIPRNLITARLMTRRYVDALLQFPEREICIAGLWALTGFAQVGCEVEKSYKGSTTYDWTRKVGRFVDALTSFSNRPLIWIFYLGSLLSAVSGAAAVYLIVRQVFFGALAEGWPSLIVSIWLLGGITILCLGVIAIYLSKMFMETKQRPRVIVRAVYSRASESPEPRESRFVVEPAAKSGAMRTDRVVPSPLSGRVGERSEASVEDSRG